MPKMTAHDDALVPIVEGVFVIVGFFYARLVLHPLPMTYLSEISFPPDFCLKMMASAMLFLAHGVHSLCDAVEGSAWHRRARDANPSSASDSHVVIQLASWGVASTLLWMEHRRGRSPSLLLRAFWIFTWLYSTFDLFAHEHVAQMDLDTRSSVVTVWTALVYTCVVLLGVSCCFESTAVSADHVELPLMSTPSAYLQSWNGKLPAQHGAGTFGTFDIRSGTSTRTECEHHRLTRSAVSRKSSSRLSRGSSRTLSAISITIPASTASMWGKNHFISYKIVVKTDDDRWSVRRQYSDFAALHDQLPSVVKEACKLPHDDAERKYLSWKGKPRPMKTKLEKYLRRVLSHRSFEPYSSQALCDFLEMEYVDEALLQSLCSDPQLPDSIAQAEQQ